MKEKVQTMEIIPAEVARKRTDTALTARRLNEIMVKISRKIQETAKGEYMMTSILWNSVTTRNRLRWFELISKISDIASSKRKPKTDFIFHGKPKTTAKNLAVAFI